MISNPFPGVSTFNDRIINNSFNAMSLKVLIPKSFYDCSDHNLEKQQNLTNIGDSN